MRYNPTDVELDKDVYIFKTEDAIKERHELQEKLIYLRQKIETVTRMRLHRLMRFHELPLHYDLYLATDKVTIKICAFWLGLTRDVYYNPAIGITNCWKSEKIAKEQVHAQSEYEYFGDYLVSLKSLTEIKNLLCQWESTLDAEIYILVLDELEERYRYVRPKDLP
jgi:hypothetical protein